MVLSSLVEWLTHMISETPRQQIEQLLKLKKNQLNRIDVYSNKNWTIFQTGTDAVCKDTVFFAIIKSITCTIRGSYQRQVV